MIWNFAELIALRGVGVFVTLLLAKYLSPEDFGLIAMMAVFLALGSTLMDSGFKQALIRLKEATSTDFDTAFYANLSLAAVTYIILFTLAPYISNFYAEPRLTSLIRVLSLVILINSFHTVHVAQLSRALNFKLKLKSTVPASVISGAVAVALAIKGGGVWALVIQIILAAIIQTSLLWILQGWRPSGKGSFSSFKSMYGFGYKLFFAGLLDNIFSNVYVIVIAKMFTASLAGYYFFAEKIRQLVINQLVSAVQTVTYPALASVQDNDERLKLGYKKVVMLTTYILFPIMFFFAALVEPLFELLLPSNWQPAAPYLQLMCIASLLYPLHAINLNILKVKGRSDLFLCLEIIKKIVAVLILLVSYEFGVYGILIGQIFGSLIAYIPNSYFSSRLISYPAAEQVRDFLPALMLASFIAAIGYFLVEYLSAWNCLVLSVVLGVLMGISYVFGGWFLKLTASQLAEQFFMERLKNLRNLAV